MLAKSWTIYAPEYIGQLLAQMSALRDDAEASTEHASAESCTSSRMRKHVSNILYSWRVSIFYNLGVPAFLTLAHLPHPATLYSSGYKLSVLATRGDAK